VKKRKGRIAGIAAVLLLAVAAIAGAAVAGMAAHAASASMTTRVKVTETDYKISLSKHSVKPGRVTFVVVNHGMVAHEFAIHGHGLNKRIAGKIMPGSKKTLKVRLRKGTYTIDCPIHVALGMKTTIHVGATSGGGGTTTNGTTTGGGWG
jgi:plastocyanin